MRNRSLVYALKEAAYALGCIYMLYAAARERMRNRVAYILYAASLSACVLRVLKQALTCTRGAPLLDVLFERMCVICSQIGTTLHMHMSMSTSYCLFKGACGVYVLK
jgi:hypothetical protein